MADGTVTTEAPAPLVPLDVDLRGMQFMPLDVLRLRDSQLAIRETGDAFRAAVLLWCASWNQIPAASLPNDDVDLTYFAGYGKDLKSWRKVKAGAMRGYVLCSDGRWYHPVVAEKALKAWQERQEYQDGQLHADDRKKRERRWRKAAFEALKAINVVPEWNTKTGALRTLADEHGISIVVSDNGVVTTNVTPVTPPVTVTGHAVVTAKRERVTGRGRETGIGRDLQEQKDSLRSSSSAAAPPTTDSDSGGGLGSGQGGLDSAAAKAERLRTHTRNAMSAYNATLARPHGVLSKVTEVGIETREQNVKRCLRMARRICEIETGSPVITMEFWEKYFAAVALDDFRSGRGQPGKDHPNWKPTFEYLTKAKTMLEVYEAVLDGSGDEFLEDDGEAQP